jgi:hypothetical protein
MGEWMYRPTIYWSRHYFELSSQLHAPPLYPRYPLGRRLGGPQSRSGRYEVKILDSTGTPTQTFGRSARSQSLCRLLQNLYYSMIITDNILNWLAIFFGDFNDRHWPTERHTFVFGGTRVQISADRTAILIDALWRFLQVQQENVEKLF